MTPYDSDARVAVVDLQWKLTRTLVLRGLTVVDESGVWRRTERDLRRRWCRNHDVDIELHFLDAPVAELTRRVAERNLRLGENEAHIEPGLVEFWSDRIEPPDATELALFDPATSPGRLTAEEPAHDR